MSTGFSSRLTIFEGPDGGGKTTLGRTYAERTGARYVHFGPLPNVSKGLPRLYVEAMLPALLGYQDVVFDRCWLSETPYGDAFRGGADRMTVADRRMLERLSLRCGAVVVRCQPPWATVKANYLSRKHLEMLENEHQLRQVYRAYEKEPSALPMLVHDYTQVNDQAVLDAFIEDRRHPCHPLNANTAGSWTAKTALVGQDFAERKDQDPFYQWPFASFSNQGCSQWLTNHLVIIGKPESELLWINADQNLTGVTSGRLDRLYYALGDEAFARLKGLGIAAVKLPHPQQHKRFHAKQPYPLRFS